MYFVDQTFVLQELFIFTLKFPNGKIMFFYYKNLVMSVWKFRKELSHITLIHFRIYSKRLTLEAPANVQVSINTVESSHVVMKICMVWSNDNFFEFHVMGRFYKISCLKFQNTHACDDQHEIAGDGRVLVPDRKLYFKARLQYARELTLGVGFFAHIPRISLP